MGVVDGGAVASDGVDGVGGWITSTAAAPGASDPLRQQVLRPSQAVEQLESRLQAVEGWDAVWCSICHGYGDENDTCKCRVRVFSPWVESFQGTVAYAFSSFEGTPMPRKPPLICSDPSIQTDERRNKGGKK